MKAKNKTQFIEYFIDGIKPPNEIKIGVEQEKFSKIFNSGTIAMAADFAEKKQEKYRLRGTPEIVVNGKYRISGRSAGSQTEMLQVASFLIDKERAQLK